MSASAFLLFVAVTLWVAGFDIIYALMDLGVDREQNIRSLPQRFGDAQGRRFAIVLHALSAVALAAAGVAAGASWLYDAGVAAAVLLPVYEGLLLHRVENLFVVNERVFTANMAFSVLFLATTIAGAAWR